MNLYVSEKIPLTINVNVDLYNKIRNVIGYNQSVLPFTNKDLPTTDEEIINAALFNYFRSLDTITGYFTIERRALNLEEGNKIKNRFKDILKMIGMKNKELAQLTGIDDATISTMLANKNQPSIEYFLRIWSVLGCPPIEDVFYREKS